MSLAGAMGLYAGVVKRGRPRIDVRWDNAIDGYLGEHPDWSAKRILNSLRNAAKMNPGKFPGLETLPIERTVGRRIEKFKKLPKKQQKTYTFLRWPESFGDGPGLLPWEAARVCMDLLVYYGGDDVLGRPTVKEARWFWRVTQALPRPQGHDEDTLRKDMYRRTLIARALAYIESLADGSAKARVESELLTDYLAGVVNGVNPFPSEFVGRPLSAAEAMHAIERLLVFQPWESDERLDLCRNFKLSSARDPATQ